VSRLDRAAAHWDGEADRFDAEPDHGLRDPAVRAAWAARLRSWLPPAPADLLDLGCGTGSLALLAAEAGHRVVGVDLSGRMVERARAKLDAARVAATLLVGDAADPPVGGATFDAVLVRHLVWTLPEPEAALRRWVGLLRRPGRIVLVEGRWETAAGITAGDLGAALAPLVGQLRTERLDDPALWGRPVQDERYALIGEV
jgi:ubiquinone/menaquinone biosynthesis C-methylase UbiE